MDEKQLIGIVTFLIAVVIIHMSAGNKATYYFLILVLLGMVLSYSDKFKNVGGNK